MITRKIAFLAVLLVSGACSNGAPDITRPPIDTPSTKPPTFDSVFVRIGLASFDTPASATTARAVWVKDGKTDSVQSAIVGSEVRLGVPTDLEGIALTVFGDPLYYPISMSLKGEAFRNRVVSAAPLRRMWPIQRGVYRGQTVPISLSDITSAAAPGDPMKLYLFTDIERPSGSYRVPASWDLGALPIPVVFNRKASASPISAADSMLIWDKALKGLLDTLGRNYFVPATLTSDIVPDGVIQIIVGNNPESAPGQAAADIRSDWRGVTTRGTITLPSRIYLQMHNVPAVQHEFGHVLGLGHTCARPTLMASNDCRGMWALRWTPEDVAMLELSQELQAASRRVGALYGIFESSSP